MLSASKIGRFHFRLKHFSYTFVLISSPCTLIYSGHMESKILSIYMCNLFVKIGAANSTLLSNYC